MFLSKVFIHLSDFDETSVIFHYKSNILCYISNKAMPQFIV